jgi:hypothetical protein
MGRRFGTVAAAIAKFRQKFWLRPCSNRQKGFSHVRADLFNDPDHWSARGHRRKASNEYSAGGFARVGGTRRERWTAGK